MTKKKETVDHRHDPAPREQVLRRVMDWNWARAEHAKDERNKKRFVENAVFVKAQLEAM